MNLRRVAIASLLCCLTACSGSDSGSLDPGRMDHRLDDLPDEDRLAQMLRLSEYFMEADTAKARIYAEKALDLAREPGDSGFISFALLNLGKINYQQHNYQRAAGYFEQAYRFLPSQPVDSLKADLDFYWGLICNTQRAFSDSESYLTSALVAYEKSENPIKLAKAYFHLGNNCYDQGNLQGAIEGYEKARELARSAGEERLVADIYNTLGVIYFDLGSFEKSLDNYMNSLQLVEKLDDSVGIARSLNNIGIVYYEWGNLEKALEYYQKSLKIELELGNELGTAGSYNNIGIVYSDWDQNHLAIEYYKRSMAIYEEFRHYEGIADALNNIGESYSALKMYDRALEYLVKSLELEQKYGSKIGAGQSYHAIASLYFSTKNYRQALEYNQMAAAIADSNNFSSLKLLTEDLYYKIYNETKQHPLSLTHYKNFVALKDTIYNTQFHEKLAALQVKFQIDQKEKEKNRFEQELINQQRSIASQKTYITIILVLLVLFGILVYSDIRRKNKAARELRMLNQKLEEKHARLNFALDELTRSEHKYRNLVQNSPTGILLMDLSGTILEVNQKLLEILGSPGEAATKEINCLSFPPLLSIGLPNDLLFCIETGESRHIEREYTSKWGKNVYLNIYITPVKSQEGQVKQLILNIEDISNSKKSENNLIESTRKLAEVNAMKDKFFSIIAHDLKNPFNAILGFSNLLYEAYDNFDESQRKKFIKNICEASESTFKLLQNLLDWSRTQTGNIDFHPALIDLSVIANEYISLLTSSAAAKQITLNMNIPFNTTAFADENMIKTVIRNLLSNAVKFTKPGGTVSISAENKDGRTTLCVEDTGVGIDEDNLKRLFRIDEHFRMKGTANEMGTGLGLILCKEFVEKSGGKIWAESTLGAGSRFYFTLPGT